MTSLALLIVLLAPALPAGAQPGPSMPAALPEAPAAPAAAPPSSAPPEGRARKTKRETEREPEVAESTGGVRALGVDDIYGGAKLRDPFMRLSGAGAGVAAVAIAAPPKEYDPEDFSIHQLELKGIMRDKAGLTALLTDMNTHFTFILRGGRLYDMRKKAVPGVTGVIQMAQKTVTLTTADKDVQTLRLGEDADEAEE